MGDELKKLWPGLAGAIGLAVLGFLLTRDINSIDQSIAYLQTGVNTSLANQQAQMEINRAVADKLKTTDDQSARQYQWFQTQFANINSAMLELARGQGR